MSSKTIWIQREALFKCCVTHSSWVDGWNKGHVCTKMAFFDTAFPKTHTHTHTKSPLPETAAVLMPGQMRHCRAIFLTFSGSRTFKNVSEACIYQIRQTAWTTENFNIHSETWISVNRAKVSRWEVLSLCCVEMSRLIKMFTFSSIVQLSHKRLLFWR